MIRQLIQVAFEKFIYNAAPSTRNSSLKKKRRKAKIDIFILLQLSPTSSIRQETSGGKNGKEKEGKKAKQNLLGNHNIPGPILGTELTQYFI